MNCRLVVIAYSSCIAQGLGVGPLASICIEVCQGPAPDSAKWVLPTLSLGPLLALSGHRGWAPRRQQLDPKWTFRRSLKSIRPLRLRWAFTVAGAHQFNKGR